MFPNDAITIFQEISGNTTINLVSGTQNKTILALSMIQSKDLSDTELKCGSQTVAKNYHKDLPFNFLNYQCNQTISLQKTGNDASSLILTYVPYYTSDFATSSQYGYNPSYNIASSSDVEVYGSISAGELLISFFLFALLWIKLVEYMVRALSKIKTKKHFLGYGGGDVEMREDN